MDFEDFCQREWPRLVSALELYCGQRQVAEDLAQDALVRVYARWPRVRKMSSPGGFTHRVAINLANTHWRRRAAERRARAQLNGQAIPTGGDDAERVMLRSVVAGLPSQQRAALVLRYWVGLSAAETGEALGLSDGAVRTLTHRGVAALRKHFRDDELPPQQEASR